MSATITLAMTRGVFHADVRAGEDKYTLLLGRGKEAGEKFRHAIQNLTRCHGPFTVYCSSSIDFPDEHGGHEQAVEEFLEGAEAVS